VRNSLHLIHAEVDTIDPDDIAYVSSGYAPLSVRIVQTSIKGWTNGREDVLKENLGGGGGGGSSSGGVRFVDVLQRRSGTTGGGGGAPEDLATALKRKPPGSLGQWAEAMTTGSSSRKPTLVVFYLGGVTYMELASLRFLSKRPAFPYHILCVTSKIVNGTTLLRTLSL
jgi:vacuolar protein sorting-associated protein 33A